MSMCSLTASHLCRCVIQTKLWVCNALLLFVFGVMWKSSCNKKNICMCQWYTGTRCPHSLSFFGYIGFHAILCVILLVVHYFLGIIIVCLYAWYFPMVLHENVNTFLWNINWREFRESVFSDLFSQLHVTYHKVFVVWSRFFPCLVCIASIFLSLCFSMMVSFCGIDNWHGPTLTNVVLLLTYLCPFYLKSHVLQEK